MESIGSYFTPGGQGLYKAAPPKLKSFRDTLRQRAIYEAHSNGMQYLPNETRIASDILTIDPTTDPRAIPFKPWGIFFAYFILIVYLIIHFLQYYDIFGPDTKVKLGLNVIRLFVYIGVFIITFLSVTKGWRTVEINITFQIVVVVITFLSSLAACISRAVVLSQKEQKGVVDYLNVILPFLLWGVSIIGLVSLLRRRYNGILIGEVGMLWLCVTVFLSIFITLINIGRQSYSLMSTSKN